MGCLNQIHLVFSTFNFYLTFPFIVYGLLVSILKITSLEMEHSLLYVMLNCDLESDFFSNFRKKI